MDEQMITKHRFALLAATLVLAAGLSVGCGTTPPKLSEGDQQKIAALDLALKNGILTQQEHDAKIKEIYGAAASGKPSPANTSSASDAEKLQALDRACSTGALTPEECAQKRAEITGASSSTDSMTSPSQAPPVADAFSVPPQQNANGSVYNDPRGSFSVAIPDGWTAAPQGENGATGVMITQGTSYAVVAPWATASQPSDIVVNLANQFQTKYQNFAMSQHGPSTLNGLDMAFGKFTGIDPKGAPVAMVIIGIAAPGGHFFMLLSSVHESDVQATGPALNTILQSLHFAGQ
jgi:hypothetical protein